MTKQLLLMSMLSLALGAKAQSTFNEVDYSPNKTTFTLNAPTTDGSYVPSIHLYANGRDGKPYSSLTMHKTAEGQWQAEVPGDMKGVFYTFDAGHGETPGVFAKAVGINGKRGAIIDLADTNPDGWADDKRPALASPTDLIIYEMHHRDFSIDPSSGIKNGGKFLALTEQRAIDHLKKLGITAVHILPSYDFGSIDETRLDSAQYNWGYDPVNYNVPEGSYSTDPATAQTRIREFKLMVQALHRAGIRVILDVVYNHTYNIKGSNFQRTWPDMYYRKRTDGSYSDGSGCGNETASERPLMRQFMRESMAYWAKEYHIDGFRVDLMGVHDIETMNLIKQDLAAIDPSLFVYGEGWSAGTCAYPLEKLAVKANTRQLNGIAAFSDDMRDALRGPFSDDRQGAMLTGQKGYEESVKFGIVGGIAHPQVDMTKVNYSKEPWANEPTQQISYVSCHDDMCLVDRLRASLPKGYDENDVKRLDLLAQTAVFTSQGIPFILAGEEMLRDKKGVHNSFSSPDSINHLDWTNLEKHPEIFQYYCGLTHLRKAHPAFRLGTAERVRQHLEFLPGGDCLVAYRLHSLDKLASDATFAGGKNAEGFASRETAKEIIVILNANKAERTVTIPKGTYTVLCRDGKIDLSGKLGTVKGTKATAAPQSALILARYK